MNQQIIIKKLFTQTITKENFQAYGQLILPVEHDKLYDQNDAQLQLDKGIPRFYIMTLPNRGRRFHRITRHSLCTQCLGSLAGKDWYIAVAPPSLGNKPNLSEIVSFHIPSDCFIKLEMGTWHAGPYFDDDYLNFYNLELSNTNVIDHCTYDFLAQDHLELEIIFNSSHT